MSAAPRMWDTRAPQPRPSPQDLQDEITPGPERTLNVHFNFNGHSWDAFEVLGLPAGSSAEKVEAAFQQVRAKSDTTTHEFYQMAFDAIRKRTG